MIGRLAATALLALAAAPAMAQSLRPGVKGGVPATVFFETGSSGSRTSRAAYSAATRRYTAGVSVQWEASRALAVEGDVLYHRMGYVAEVRFFSGSSGVVTSSAIDVKGHAWDFPVLVKRRFGRGARPFVAGGGVLRYVGPVRGKGESMEQNLITGAATRAGIDTGEPSDLRKRLYPGLVAGAGVEVRTGRLRWTPEFRYTRWTANIAGRGGLLRFAPNQAEFLLGVML